MLILYAGIATLAFVHSPLTSLIMSLVVDINQNKDRKHPWIIYHTTHTTEAVLPLDSVTTFELANYKGKFKPVYFRRIGKHIDYASLYPYIVESQQVSNVSGKILGRCTINVAEFKERVASAFCSTFSELIDGCDAYVKISKAPRLIISKEKGNYKGAMGFSIPFLKGLLLSTPGIEPNSNISFITVTDSGDRNSIYILLGNQLYSPSDLSGV